MTHDIDTLFVIANKYAVTLFFKTFGKLPDVTKEDDCTILDLIILSFLRGITTADITQNKLDIALKRTFHNDDTNAHDYCNYICDCNGCPPECPISQKIAKCTKCPFEGKDNVYCRTCPHDE